MYEVKAAKKELLALSDVELRRKAILEGVNPWIDRGEMIRRILAVRTARLAGLVLQFAAEPQSGLLLEEFVIGMAESAEDGVKVVFSDWEWLPDALSPEEEARCIRHDGGTLIFRPPRITGGDWTDNLSALRRRVE